MASPSFRPQEWGKSSGFETRSSWRTTRKPPINSGKLWSTSKEKRIKAHHKANRGIAEDRIEHEPTRGYCGACCRTGRPCQAISSYSTWTWQGILNHEHLDKQPPVHQRQAVGWINKGRLQPLSISERRIARSREASIDLQFRRWFRARGLLMFHLNPILKLSSAQCWQQRVGFFVI